MAEDKLIHSATFGAGCFWGVEEVFRIIPGVVSTEVGYEGGHIENPSYQDVCSNQTGHAETIEIKFDPSRVSYKNLLKVFWENHNPTTLNRQGPDTGTQYRSVIFYHSPEQKKAAEDSKVELEKSDKWIDPIVTEITPAKTFYKAEDYHQKYLQKRGLDSCAI